MKILIIIIILFIVLIHPISRYAIMHPITSVYWAFYDIYKYFKYKEYRKCKEYGKIKMYSAQDAQAFGCGKSLSMAHYCGFLDNKYDGQFIYDEKDNKWHEQRLIFISNLELKNVRHYIPFIGKSQFENIDKIAKDDYTIVFFVLDEAGIVFNSRQYKDNIPTAFLTKLLQIRHNKVGFILNAQRFTMVDKIIRETCNVVTTCKKIWRFVILTEYDAFSLENAQNPSLVQPISSHIWFSKNSDFEAYDTNYNIGQLKKELEEGDIMSTEEILATRGEDSDVDRVTNIRRKYKKRFTK